MKDLKRQSNRRPAVRKLGTSSVTVRKNRSNPIPGISVKLRKPVHEPGFRNSWVPSYFIENEPAVLRNKIRWLVQRLFGICGLIFILWLAGGSLWVGQAFFKQPLKKVHIEGNQLLNVSDVLRTSGLRPGHRLSNLKPYQIAAQLQTHPIVQKADIRRKFPDEIHLILSEHQPVALLKISQEKTNLSTDTSPNTNFVLIGYDQRLLKQLPIDVLLNSPHSSLPLIKGLTVSSMRLGKRLNSPVLERGLKLLTTLQGLAAAQKSEQLETLTRFEDQFRMVDWSAQKIRIDISDPLNLKINWPLKSSAQPGTPVPLRKVPFTIQMGSRNFNERLHTFQNIYPTLGNQHPGLQSVDLRYKNRVMLIPL
ncbi:MAG: Cell division protein FtsQ [Deltaproteobacteria bacterium]|jgi:cell division septal protein FtsQ|nr:Cell division protein FtsQ [Deltaproteobacteria bacterium]